MQARQQIFINVAAVNHPRLIDDYQMIKALNVAGLCMHLSGKTFIQT